MNRETPGQKELRDFGLITGALFAVLFGLIFPWLGSHRFPLCRGLSARGLGGSATATTVPEYLFAGWSRLGLVLGWINSRIALTVIFYLVIVPMGFLMQLFGQDPMARDFDPEVATYRVPSSNSPVETMEKPF